LEFGVIKGLSQKRTDVARVPEEPEQMVASALGVGRVLKKRFGVLDQARDRRPERVGKAGEEAGTRTSGLGTGVFDLLPLLTVLNRTQGGSSGDGVRFLTVSAQRTHSDVVGLAALAR